MGQNKSQMNHKADRQTDRVSWRTRTRTSMAWQPPCPKHPSSPQSICGYEDSLYPLEGLGWCRGKWEKKG